MVNYIKIGGKERPLAFGYAVAYAYESQTGGNYNELLFQVAGEIDQVRLGAAEAKTDRDIIDAASAMHIKPITDLVLFGLKYAHRKEGVEIDFEPEDVAEWLFTDQKAMQDCVTALFESLPKPSGEIDTSAKKKMTARPGSTGKGLSKRLRQ
jgi:hypothetical protein